jgi:5'-3' exonuclease
MSYTHNASNILHNTNLISLYPKYNYLKSFLEVEQEMNYKNRLNVFFDMKNLLGLSFMEQIMAGLYNNTQLYNNTDMSIFISFMNHLKRMKEFLTQFYPNVNFIYFMDNGESKYHKKYHIGYKANRTTTTKLTEAVIKGFMEIYHINLNITGKVMNKIKDSYLVCLNQMESDFIPYFIINEMNNISDDSLNIVFSNDKDMYQCINLENTYCYIKNYFTKTDYVLNKENAVKYYLKDNTLSGDVIGVLKYFDLLLALAGDTADSIDGIKGVGPKSAYKIIIHLLQEKILPQNYKLFINQLYSNENIFKNNVLNMTDKIKLVNKLKENIDKVIRNIKLTSYEYLSLYLKDTESEKSNYNIIYDTLKINKAMTSHQYSSVMSKLKIPQEIITESSTMFQEGGEQYGY